jgi:hypothetical protein
MNEGAESALRDYLQSQGFNPDRLGNWNTHEGIGLARHAFLAGWEAASNSDQEPNEETSK